MAKKVFGRTFEQIKRVGEIGECLVRLELAKRNIYVNRMNLFCGFDYYSSNGFRIEVKTARVGRAFTTSKYNKKYYQEHWQFLINKKLRDYKYDFLILVCLNKEEEVERYYIIPTNELNLKGSISVHKSTKYIRNNKFEKYKNNWGLLVESPDELIEELKER